MKLPVRVQTAAVALAAILACGTVAVAPCGATGFLIYNQHAAANAAAVAYTAQVDNPSAVFYNPAALSRLSGTRVTGGGTLLIPRTSFKSDATGGTSHMKHHAYLLPTAYVTHQINERFSIGIGAFSHFGLSTDWNDDWEGRWISTFAELRTFFINPVVSIRINPALSVACGVSPVYSTLRFKKALQLAPRQRSLGTADLEARGSACGFNLALLYQAHEHITCGISYRSAIDITYDGDADFMVTPLLKPLLPRGNPDIDIELPPILAGGIAAQVTERLTVEFDLIWVGFSSFDELFADFPGRVNPLVRRQLAPIPRDYKDVIDYAVGARYRVTESLALLCGFLFDRSAAPEENVDPLLPESDKYIAGAGISIALGRWDLHCSYYAVFSADAHVRRSASGFNGTYESYTSLVSLNLGYRF
jgi:long-chain fatty acid transport protein